MVRRWVVTGSVVLFAVLLCGCFGVAAAGSPADSGGLSAPAPTNDTATESTDATGTVPLVTGQTVTVRGSGDRRRYLVDAAVPMERTVQDGDTYVYPASVDFDRYDRELFNVDRLLAHSGVGNGSVPVIVERNEAVAGSVASVTGFERSATLESIDATAGTVSVGAGATAGGALGSHPAVGRIHLDREYEVTLNDSTEVIDAVTARNDYDVSGEGVTVAVLDTGVNESHPDLDEGTEIYEEDFTGEGTTVDVDGHGTHVAGTVAGDGDASGGTYTGVAPNASIMDLRVLDSNGAGSTSGIIRAIETAVDRDADVISMSLGGPASGDGPLVNASEAAVRQGTLVVAAAGNDGGRETVGSPGIASGVLTVGASDGAGGVAPFSSEGPTPVSARVKPDIVAPGVGITAACAEAGCAYRTLDGTSMATPQVSGAAALVMAARPNWTAGQVHDALLTSADPLARNGTPLDAYEQGAGRLDVDDAIAQDILIDDATLSFGVVNGSRATETVSITNVGTDVRTLNVSATLRDADTGATVGGVSVNRSGLTISPGESRTLELTARIDAGVYSGRLRLSEGNRTHTSAFGLSALRRLSVRKAGIGGTSVRGDVVNVLPLSTFDPTVPQSQQVESEFLVNGPAEFTVEADRALVYSYGIHDFTGVPILTLDVVDLRQQSTVVLNESETVTHRVDTGRLGPANLTTLGAAPRGQFYVGHEDCGDTVPVAACHAEIRPSSIGVTGPDREPRVRYSPHPALNTSTRYTLVPTAAYDPGRPGIPSLDSPTVFDLTFATAGVGPDNETYRPERSVLGELQVRYHRTHPSGLYDIGATATPDSLPSVFEFPRYWRVGDRVEQTRYVTPNVSTRLWVRAQDFDWDRYTEPVSLAPGESRVVTPGSHPIDSVYGPWELQGSEPRLAGVPRGRLFVLDSGLRSVVHVIRENGSVVDSSAAASFFEYAPSDPPASGTTYNVTSAYRQTAQNRSTRMVSSFQGTWHETGDPTPPRIDGIDLPTADRYSRLRTARVPVTVETDGSVTDLTLGYSTAADPSTPLNRSALGAAADWTTVPVSRTGPGRFAAIVSPDTTSGDLHLLAVATDAEGDTGARLVERASRLDVDTTEVSIERVDAMNGSGESAGVALALSTDGSSPTQTLVTASVGGANVSRTVSVPANGSVERFVPLSEAGLSAGDHTVTVAADGTTEQVTVNVTDGAFSLPGSTAGATTVDGDALLEDVNGDGVLDRDDVLAYYEHRDSDVIRDNPARFDFDGDGVAGQVSDALALYESV